MNAPPFPQNPVFLVDDEEDVLQSYRMALRYAGITNLFLCQDSREAMGHLSRMQVSCAVLDLFMPHLTGQKLLEMIKAAYPQIPVIVITGSDDVETAIQCMEKGAFNFLVKPVEREQLTTAVQRALQMPAQA